MRHSNSLLIRTLITISIIGVTTVVVGQTPPPPDPYRPAGQPLDPRIDPEKVGERSRPALPGPVLLPLPADHAIASDPRDVPVSAEHWTAAERLLRDGLAYLVRAQDESGGWMTGATAQPTAVGDGPAPPPGPVDVAVTAMVVKAIAQGRTAAADRAAVDDALGRGIAFINRARTPDGGYGGGSLANYVTSSVVSALAALNDPLEYGGAIAADIRRLSTMQWDQDEGVDPTADWFGGAGYGKHGRPDLSNTQMMLDALYDAGLSPDEPAFQRALAFVSRTQNLRATNDADWASDDGGFVYSPARGGESMASEAAGEGRFGEIRPDGAPRSLRSYGSMTYAGFKSLLYAGLSPDDERVRAAYDWVRRHFTFDENPGLGGQGHFYYLHAMARALRVAQQHVVTDIDGVRHNWREELIDAAASMQHDDGAWRNPADRWLESEPALATAYLLLAVQEALKPASAIAPEDKASLGMASGLQFVVTFAPEIAERYTGRVYVLTGPVGGREPRFGPAWFSSQPFVARDVMEAPAGEPIVLDAATALAYPVPVNAIPEDEYAVQAVLRLNPNSSELGSGAGNAYSPAVTTRLDGANGGRIELHVDQRVAATTLADTDRLKWIDIPSPLLSAFHGHDVRLRAAVWLPSGYDDDRTRAWPVQYVIGGFGSSHRMARWLSRRWTNATHDDRLARVVLDPSGFGGHHVFANSANNGPRGDALVTELIPELERRFRFAPRPSGRFLTGHSSGGWSSLWLQMTYPEFFGGTWSTAPDSVDFTRFQTVDVYAPDANMYVSALDGGRAPIAQRGGEAFAFADDFSAMETVLGEGGQLRAFEWVFSPRGADGRPMKMYDRATGAVDASVAATWKKYDIRHQLESRWDDLGPRVAGKLNVFMGDQDTFYLHYATMRLKDTLEHLGSDAVVEIRPGKDHGTLLDAELSERIDREMVETFERGG